MTGVRSLSWKLGGALLLMVVISVGLMAYITNRSTTEDFRQYVAHGGMMHARSVERTLSQLYIQEEGWSDLRRTLDNLLTSENERLMVTDSSGIVIGDTARQWLGRNAIEAGLTGGVPIIVSGEEVGELYLLSFEGMMGMGHMGGRGNPPAAVFDVAEQDFLSQFNRSLWLAGLIAAGVALLLGLVLTRQVTRPLRALTRGAREIARGELGHRVKVSSRDELGNLADSFNAMANSLERSEQARQRLTADIAHELRTPLTVIEGTVDGILDGVFEPDKEHLGSVKEQTALLTRLIGDLRDLSLAESGQLKLELAPTDMVELVRRKLSQAELSSREKHLQLAYDAAPEIPEVKVDSARMEQVMANLMANAIRHTSAGGRITVAIRTVTSDIDHQITRPSLVISIADTGEGIAAEHLPHIFERFYRVEHSRTRSEGGAGLGLAIVNQMVAAHQGKVWVSSEPGQGSTFFVAIPLAAG
jgi:two-component system OmpR family sensor kinase